MTKAELDEKSIENQFNAALRKVWEAKPRTNESLKLRGRKEMGQGQFGPGPTEVASERSRGWKP